ncbi:MAG: DNA polymerase I [Deltaproteobacteria bacterium]|nr:DNA polymerase I [Deltaproteobacteria bacterium]
MKHLYLIDGSGYIFRAYYAIRPLSTSKGLPTNAIYGFTQMLLKLQKEAKPDYWAIVFDTKEPTFRDEMFADYKANRKEPPDDLVPQFAYFPKIVEALNIPMLAKPGFEADDLIATAAGQARDRGFEVTIISGDKDLMQLVGPNIRMWDTMKEKHYEPKDVAARFGVPPEQVTDVMGLAGDAVDNIPGVHGVGPKTAAQLIQEYGTLENVLKNTAKLKGKLKENIEKFADQARLSKQLATLAHDVPFEFDEKKLAHRPLNTEACHTLFRELEFARLLADLVPKETLSKKGYQLITRKGDLETLARTILADRPMLAIDLETDSLDVMRADIVGMSLSWAKGQAVYLPTSQIGLLEIKKILGSLLTESKIPKVGQNIKFDLAILNNHGLEVRPILADTMIASYLLNPQGPHNLDDLAQQHLDHRTIRYEEVVGKGKKQIAFADVPLEQARDYACEDADCTWQLAQLFLPQLEKEGLIKLFKEVEMPLMEVLLKMELAGVKVDGVILKKLSKDFDTELKKLEKKIYEMGGGEFNINSPRQLGEVLFEKLKLPGGKKTKTGFSTAQDILENLAAKHPLPNLVLEYRSLGKLKSTYTDALVALIHPKTGRIHTSFNQTIAATGRLSSSDPNLQNIPIRSPEGRKIREAFTAEPGFLLLSADYSQIELRILAHLTEDEGLVKAFQEGQDIHQLTADALGCDRGAAKTVNFAVIYGQSPYGLSQGLKIDMAEASEYIEGYFKKYPKVKPFREKILEKARTEGKVTTLFGRRRFVPDILSRNVHVRQNAERMAFNTVFQGSAADIIKKAMINIDRGLAAVSTKTRMILQVHDELVFEVPDADREKVAAFVKIKMEGAFALKIPLVVDCGVGKNWSEAH